MSSAGEVGGTTVIRQGSAIQGSITGRGNVVVEGQFEGDIVIDAALTVAAGGSVKANVQAASIAVAGVLVGNLVAKDRVEVLASGSVDGDITAARLVISDGATLRGSVKINRGGAGAAAAQAPPAAPAANGPKKP
jgi:cytoskeletal protein CcmA (bactofilin family)